VAEDLRLLELKEAAILILTHPAPDLDAIGFVYSARKVFGGEKPAACRTPTREELEDPAIIVGDIGLPGCEEIGYSTVLNNFDHHYSHADRSATYLFNQKFGALREDIVAYVDAVDLVGGREAAEATLKAATVGVRVRHAGDDLAVLAQGGRLLRWLEETDTPPGDLSGPVPEDIGDYLRSGQVELRRIREELPAMRRGTTNQGRSVGYLVSASPVVSIVKEELFALGLDIAIVYNPATRRYAIAANVRGASPINLKRRGLADALNAEEWRRGAPPAQRWDGHDDRIGSPRPSGSLLTGGEVLAIVVAVL
jgi:hypothetical protein